MVTIVKEKRGSNIDVKYLDDGSVLILSTVPWQEVVCGRRIILIVSLPVFETQQILDMSDQISNQSSGYATFNYEPKGLQAADLVKVTLYLLPFKLVL
jgi:translation elongation factor EF-4